jgi:hypothetical protein
MLSRGSALFFIVFFGLILVSIGNAFYHAEVLKDFHVYTEDDEIPRAADFYLNLLPS